MGAVPLRRPLVVETKKVLIEGITNQRWKGSLPGERGLCRQLKVSRWTIRAALVALARQGWIQIEHGRSCRILARKLRAGSKRGPWHVGCIIPEPLWRLTPFASFFLSDLRLRIQEVGGRLDFYHGPSLYRPNCAGPLSELVGQNSLSCWILILSTPWMQRWFQAKGVPVIVSGSLYEGVKLPSQDYHSRAVGRHAVGAFLARGHRRIAFMVRRLNRLYIAPGIQEVETGARDLCAAHRGGDCQFLSIHHGGSTSEVCQAIDRLLRLQAPPTGILFAQSATLLTALTYFGQLRIKIPDDLSIAVIQDEAYYPHIVPQLTHYEWNPEIYASSLCRLAEHARDGIVSADTSIRLNPVFVPGSTLSAPPSRAK